MENVIGAVAAPGGVIATLIVLAALYRHVYADRAKARSALATIVVVATGAAVWLVLGSWLFGDIPLGLQPMVTALAGLAAYLATLGVRERSGSIVVSAIFAIAWSVAVFVPATGAVFGSGGALAELGFFPLDHGGALVALVAPASAAVAILVLERKHIVSPTDVQPPSVVIWGSLALWVVWTLWLVGAELAIDEATSRILVNSVLAPVFGVIGWLIVQRIHHDTVTVGAAATGLVSGLSAITAGAAYLDPLWSSVTGLAAGILSASFVHRRVRLSGRESWFAVGSHLVAPATGIVLVGMFASEVGMLFTGQVGFLSSELASTFLVVTYSFAVSVVLWILLRATPLVHRARD